MILIGYNGVWHQEGLLEHIGAVAILYYRTHDEMQGGHMEFADKFGVNGDESEDKESVMKVCEKIEQESTLHKRNVFHQSKKIFLVIILHSKEDLPH